MRNQYQYFKLCMTVLINVNIFFFRLFETHPEVHNAFMPFRTLQTSELEYSTILRSHAMRVMSTVDKCIARLDSRPKLRELMTEMGIRHQNYTVKMEYIDVSKILFSLCKSLAPVLLVILLFWF